MATGRAPKPGGAASGVLYLIASQAQLLRDEAQLEQLRRIGPMQLLRACAGERGQI